MNTTNLRRTLVLPFLLAAVAGFSAKAQETPRKQSDDAAEAEVLRVRQQLGEAGRKKDQAALESILADRLSWIARGERLNKAQVLSLIHI